MGANIIDNSREKFAEYCRKTFAPLVAPRFTALLQDLYGTYVDLSAPSKTVKSWDNLMTEFKFDPSTPFFGILVPTVDTTRYRYLLEKLMSAGHNVLFMAETGVGKSSVVSSFLNDMVAGGKTVSYIMSYSAQTKVRDFFLELLLLLLSLLLLFFLSLLSVFSVLFYFIIAI